MIFGEYDEALDKQEQEKYLREETEAARSEGEKNGTKQNAIQTAKKLLKELPEWSDQKIAEIANDISAEEVAELRKGKEIHFDN